ncbi:MAG: thermonuclease family protein [Candidatus Pacebacteria bacterium]|nr:thermonuclease family protein [Candidatus Paceibacterota bacterium]
MNKKSLALMAVIILGIGSSQLGYGQVKDGIRTERVTITGKAFVIDGDTLVIRSRHIRLQGIDAPEYKQTCQRPDGVTWGCGLVAARQLRQKLEGAKLTCIGEQWDKYGRLLANCFLGEQNLNRWVVASGWAIAYRFFTTEFAPEEEQAKATKLGIWSSRFIEPYQWRQSHRQK